MALTNLQQDTYKDGGGHEAPATVVECLAPYVHVADGFYRWTCGRCNVEHFDRSCGWPISGQVLQCVSGAPAFGDKPETGCGAMNLLVRTNCIEIDEALTGKFRAPERERQLERLKDIERLNAEQVACLKRDILYRLEVALKSLRAADAVDPQVGSTGTDCE